MASLGPLRDRVRTWMGGGPGSFYPRLFSPASPLDLRIVGRVLLQAALVGVATGLVGALFFMGLELVQQGILERLAGYRPLRASGEVFGFDSDSVTVPFRPWLLAILPAVGGLLCGVISQYAPEVRGGGGDATIEAFHHRQGVIRRRVLWTKFLASLATLGFGGAGGREGPTMQMGGAIGSLLGRTLGLSARERRILLVAGVAGGISAVFRTPLGAALFAVEVLYRDGFESDALVPSILSSVVSYSVVIPILGEGTLFSHSARFPFIPAHLLLFGVMALLLSVAGILFLAMMSRLRRLFSGLPVPLWARPALGGLVLGLFAMLVIGSVGHRIHLPGQGLGLLGGGYGAVQLAISGAPFLPGGWNAVSLLAVLAIAKMLAASLTIGSGGSAGDFAPSLAIGGLLGGAFGRSASLLIGDPRIDPGAFALAGMAAFYGGIAHVPLSALVLACELAGNYDLLVPLMLAQGITFVALRRRSLYPAQPLTYGTSPAHPEALSHDKLGALRVRDRMLAPRDFQSFSPRTPAQEMLTQVANASWQDVFPVLDGDQKMVGLVTASSLQVFSADPESVAWMLAADLMVPPVLVHPEDGLSVAAERLVSNGLREIPVVDDTTHTILGFLDEQEIAAAYLGVAREG